MNKPKAAFFLNLSEKEFNSQSEHIREILGSIWDITFFNELGRTLSTFEKLELYLEKSIAEMYDFSFFSLSPFSLSSKEKIKAVIDELLLKEKAIAFRLGTFKGLDVTYPPKLPLIDPSLIIIFPQHSQIKRRANYYPHFRSWDPIYFDLYAFIENYFHPSSFCIFDSEENLLDKYGIHDGFSMDGFTYSPMTGLITFKTPLAPKLEEVKQKLILGDTINVFLNPSFFYKAYNKLKIFLRLKVMQSNELVKKYDI